MEKKTVIKYAVKATYILAGEGTEYVVTVTVESFSVGPVRTKLANGIGISEDAIRVVRIELVKSWEAYA